MIKVGDKVMVAVKVTQIVEDEEGVRYVVVPDGKKDFCNSMRVQKENIQLSTLNA